VNPARVHRLPVPDTPVAAGTLGALLHHATANVRMAEDSKASGDPYYLLNSFYTWLHVYVVVQGVEGIRRGVYQYDFDENALLAVGTQPSDEDLASTIQGQNWIGGGGVSVFVVVQWDRYQWLYRHSRAYLNLLIQIGEFAQELLQAAYQLGLVGWLTPAVAESRAAAMLGLDAVDSDVDRYTTSSWGIRDDRGDRPGRAAVVARGSAARNSPESRTVLPRPRLRAAAARGGGAHRQPGRADP
jgi:SagB-type dehydrogenase family enzyme